MILISLEINLNHQKLSLPNPRDKQVKKTHLRVNSIKTMILREEVQVVLMVVQIRLQIQTKMIQIWQAQKVKMRRAKPRQMRMKWSTLRHHLLYQVAVHGLTQIKYMKLKCRVCLNSSVGSTLIRTQQHIWTREIS